MFAGNLFWHMGRIKHGMKEISQDAKTLPNGFVEDVSASSAHGAGGGDASTPARVAHWTRMLPEGQCPKLPSASAQLSWVLLASREEVGDTHQRESCRYTGLSEHSCAESVATATAVVKGGGRRI